MIPCSPPRSSSSTEPGAISQLTEVEASTTSISISWDPPGGDVGMYTVTWSRGDDEENTTHVRQPRAVLTGLTPGTAYTITVAAVSGNQRGEAFTFVNVTGRKRLSSPCG